MNKSPHVEIYRSDSPIHFGLGPLWRWRFRSSNGKILSQSSESYSDPRDLVRGLELSFPGWKMRDEQGGLNGYGGWYLWQANARVGTVAWLLPEIPVRVPEGTVKLWRARRKR